MSYPLYEILIKYIAVPIFAYPIRLANVCNVSFRSVLPIWIISNERCESIPTILATFPSPVPKFSKTKFSMLNSVDVAVCAIVILSTSFVGHPPLIVVSKSVVSLDSLNLLASSFGTRNSSI